MRTRLIKIKCFPIIITKKVPKDERWNEWLGLSHFIDCPFRCFLGLKQLISFSALALDYNTMGKFGFPYGNLVEDHGCQVLFISW